MLSFKTIEPSTQIAFLVNPKKHSNFPKTDLDEAVDNAVSDFWKELEELEKAAPKVKVAKKQPAKAKTKAPAKPKQGAFMGGGTTKAAFEDKEDIIGDIIDKGYTNKTLPNKYRERGRGQMPKPLRPRALQGRCPRQGPVAHSYLK